MHAMQPNYLVDSIIEQGTMSTWQSIKATKEKADG